MKVTPTVCCNFTSSSSHRVAQLGVERRQRLVQQQHAGFLDQRARQCHALALTTGELVGHALLVAGEMDLGQGIGDPGFDLVRRDSLELEAVGDVLRHRHVRENGIGLEHHVHGPLVWRQIHHVDTVQQQLALGRRLEAGDRAEQGRLAAARRAEQGEELARHDVQRHVVECDHAAAEAFAHIPDRNDRFRAHFDVPPKFWNRIATAVSRRVRTIRTVEAALISGVTEKRTIE